MSEISLYPQGIDIFTTKVDSTDGNDGDYIMAEHVNKVQNAILAIENTLGTDPQGEYQSLSQRLYSLSKSSALSLPKITIYKGDPASANGCTTDEGAARYFAYFSKVILDGINIFGESAPNITRVVQETAKLGITQFYGTVDVGVSTANLALSELTEVVDKWKELGVDGIYLSNFGYDFMVSRQRQNDVIDMVRSKGLAIMASSTNIDYVFSTENLQNMNTTNDATHLAQEDSYLFLGYAVQGQYYQNAAELQSLSEKMVAYRSANGISMYAIAYISGADDNEKATKFYYAQAVALLYSLDGFYGCENPVDSNVINYYKTLPIMGAYYDKSPVISVSGSLASRMCGIGRLSVDLAAHTYSFSDIRIPLGLVDIDGDNTKISADKLTGTMPSSITIDVIGRINNDASGLTIAASKVDVDGTKVISAINLVSNGLTKISANAIDSLSEQHIEDIVIQALADQLEAELMGGTLDANFRKLIAQFISAQNAYFTTISGETGTFTGLDAGILTAGVLDAGLIDAQTITSDKLTIASNAGLNKWAGTVVRKSPGAINAPGPSNINGKDVYRKIEARDAQSISTSGSIGALSDYVVKWKTSVYCSATFSQDCLFRADTSAVLYINGTATVTASPNVGYPYSMALHEGWNTIEVYQDHNSEVSCEFNLGIKLSDYALQTEQGNITPIVRVDAYDEAVTQIIGDLIRTGTIDASKIISKSITAEQIHADAIGANEIAANAITAKHLDVDSVTADAIAAGSVTTAKLDASEVSAGLVDAGMVQAIEAYIQHLEATSGEFEILLTELLTTKFIDTSNIKIVSEANDGTNPGQLVIDNGGLIVSSAPKTLIAINGELMRVVLGQPRTFRVTPKYTGMPMASEPTPVFYLRDGTTYVITPLIGADEKPLYRIIYEYGQITIDESVDLTGKSVFVDYSYPEQYYPSGSRVVKIDREGIKISSDGGRPGTWQTKLDGSRLYVGEADISEASITNAHIKDGTIQTAKIGEGQITTALIGDAQITDAKIDRVSADKLVVTDADIQSVNAGKINTGTLAATDSVSITAGGGITIDKDGMRSNNNSFVIGTDGNVSMTGTMTAQTGSKIANWNIGANTIYDTDNKIVLDSSIPSINIDSGKVILGLYDGTNYGIKALAGKIGNLDITTEGIKAIVNGALEQFNLTPSTISLSGAEALTINTGTMVVKEGGKTYIGVGKLDSTTYGMKIYLYGTDGTLTGKYIQLDQAGLRAFDGTKNTIEIDKDGNVKITGEVNAQTGTLGTLTVNGTITAGDTIIDTTGVSGTGYALNSDGITATKGSVAGWTIDTNTISKGTLVIDSTNEKITTTGATFGQYEAGKYGISATSGTIGGWDIGTNLSAGTNLAVLDPVDYKLSFNNSAAIFGQYAAGKYGMKVGNFVVNGTDSTMSAGANFSINLTTGNATLASADISGKITAGSGAIGGWNINSNALTTPNISIESNTELINIASEVLIGKYNTTNYGIKAGDVVLNSAGLTGTGYKLGTAGLEATAGKVGGWVLSATEIKNTDGTFVLDSAGGTLKLATDKIVLSKDGSATIGSLHINNDGSFNAGSNFAVDTSGNVTITGAVTATSGSFSGDVKATSGWFGTEAAHVSVSGNGLTAGSVVLNNLGLKVGSTLSITANGLTITNGSESSINLGGVFIANKNGITATAGSIAGWTIGSTTLSKNNVTLDSAGRITLGASSQIALDAASGINVASGQFTVDLTGKLTAQNADITGKITASSGSITGSLDVGTTIDIDGANGKITVNTTDVVLDSNGITAINGRIGGWTIGADTLTGGNIILGSTGSIAVGTNVIFNNDGSGKIGAFNFTTSGQLYSGTNTTDYKFLIDTNGDAHFKGDITGASGTFSGTLSATSGSIGGWAISDTGLASNNVSINSTGNITLGSTSQVVISAANGINVAGQFTVGLDGTMTAKKANIEGSIVATDGTIGGWNIDTNDLTNGNIHLDQNHGAIWIGASLATANIRLNSAGTGNIGKLTIGSDGSLTTGTGFAVDTEGRIQATAGKVGGFDIGSTLYSGTDMVLDPASFKLSFNNNAAVFGRYDTTNYGIKIGNFEVNGTSGTLSAGTGFNIDLSTGTATLSGATVSGTITTSSLTASGGTIGNWKIGGNLSSAGDKIVLDAQNDAITISNGTATQVTIGKYDAENLLYGIKAGETILNASGITANSGTIGGITIYNNSIAAGSSENSRFSLNSDGSISATKVDVAGTVTANEGVFGQGAGAIHAGTDGIWAGNGVGDPTSTFWINSKAAFPNPSDPTKTINPGDAFFKGSVSVNADSLINGGNFVIQKGGIIAGDRNGAHVRLSYLNDIDGGEIYSQDENSNELFHVTKSGAFFKGDMTATSGSILGNLSVGSGHNIFLDGSIEHTGIYLYDTTSENPNRVVRLNNDGLYISENGGSTYDPALTGAGINANAINDGVLTISDSGHGASGISIRQWNISKNDYVENVNISPAGINVLNGAITVYSEQTGEVLIGGGYLRVKGLDMGVVTSNNYVGNGNFSMVSEKYGVMQMNAGEVFLGKAQSSGGAVSNPTYHYAGWPDFGGRGPHTIWTYKLNTDGKATPFDPSNTSDPNYPKVVRSSFNPQWSAVHPVYPYCVVPADADNFITIVDYEGNIVRNLKSWKGGLFGADFTPDGTRMVVCGDDIDRKRAPWDMVVFDTSSSDPLDWHRIGVIPVGEFPSKVVCDNSGYAYVTVSLDNTLYKLDIVNMRVEGIATLTDPRGIAVVPQPIDISHDFKYIYVGGVVSDFVYEISTGNDSNVGPFGTIIQRTSVLPYPGNRGIIHDLDTLPSLGIFPEGCIATTSASVTDAAITIIDPAAGNIVAWIDSTMTAKSDYYSDPSRTQAEKDKWNFYSSTTLVCHPTKPLIYVTVTNRCMVSILDYSTGQLREVQRIPSGSNCSGVSISVDGDRLYVPNHHYHTYPLGANKVWGYDSNTNFYATEDVFDTTQKYYHHNPAGMVTTGDGRYVWIANRATNKIVIIDTTDWDNQNLWAYIENVGNKPYELKINNAKTKVFVSNDDSNNLYEPDFVTVIDIGTKTIDGKIFVGDNPMGLEVSADDKYLYIACHNGMTVQKADIATRRIVDSVTLDGKPKHLLRVGNTLYVTCFDTDKLYCLDMNTLDTIATILCDKDPTQMAVVGSKLYVVCQGADDVLVISTATNTIESRIEVGSRPKPIAYNSVKSILYVGNSGEGSVCIIDPNTDTVTEWCMTGDNPEYICVSPDGSRWYASAQGPEDIVAYGTTSQYTGDAYVDDEGNVHKYGSEYWMPSRSSWVRGVDNTLTSFSTVEFWPTAELAGKQGYAHLSVMGMYDSFAKLEQDIYPLINNSDGSCEYTTETIQLEEGKPLKLQEDIADYSGIPGMEKRRIMLVDACDTTVKYTEGSHFTVDYDKGEISRLGTTIPASNMRQNTEPLDGILPELLIQNGNTYNTIEVYPANQTTGKYTEGTDYTIDRVGNTIARTSTSTIPDGASVTIVYRHLLKARYYYHPNKRNYSDIVLSSDLFWRWPRPENQWVRMQVDELVPKFIYVDNDNIDPWTPTFDLGKNPAQTVQYKGLRYSSISNRAENANILTSATPVSGSADSIRTTTGNLILPEGEQYITIDIGTSYYVNEIYIKHADDGRTVNNVKVQISMNGMTWEDVYLNAAAPASYTINFQKVYGETTYNGPKRVRFIRAYANGSNAGLTNQWKYVKIMGDWKINKSYTFSSNTIWDSDGRRETYLTLTDTAKVRFDDPSLTTDPLNPLTPPAQRVRYRTYYTAADGAIDVRGEVLVYNLFDGTLYKGLRNDVAPEAGVHYDYIWDHTTNLMWRTEDSSIASGEEVRVVFRFIQENLSNLPLCVAYRNPETGAPDPSVPASVAETDVTGAWIEWEFTNSYRCDWYMGWIADIGLGNVDIYLDDKLVHSISQSAAKVERFSQISTDLLPGTHKIKLVQQQGRVNLDTIKLEDYQLYYMNSNLVASPSINPVELFTWYTTKITPTAARKYLGRGTQVMSGAYDTLRVDKETYIPNNQVPIKYRVRFQTTLEGRGPAPIIPEGSYGGEAVGNEFKFERGSVLITNVTIEKGVNHTYWRMSPSEDKYPGFSIESWDVSKPTNTGIQTYHLADGVITSNKLKSFSVKDIHIANDAGIQESKLLLNFPTHGHTNKSTLDAITGFGTSGTSTDVARADHIHSELANGNFTGDVSVGGDLSVSGGIKEIGKYSIVHRRPLYGIAGDLEFETDSISWEDLVNAYSLIGYGLPAVQSGATRYYRLYAVYSDNVTDSDTMRPRLRVINANDSSVVTEWKMPNTWGASSGNRRDAFSSYFQMSALSSAQKVQIRIQNDTGTYAGGEGKMVGLDYLELIAYDVF